MEIPTKYSHVTNFTQLKFEIMQVNSIKEEQEEEIKYRFKVLYYELQPAALFKKAVGNIIHNTDLPKNMLQSGLTFGVDFLIGRIFKKNSSVKGFLTSTVIEKVADFAINSKSEALRNGMGKVQSLLKRFAS